MSENSSGANPDSTINKVSETDAADSLKAKYEKQINDLRAKLRSTEKLNSELSQKIVDADNRFALSEAKSFFQKAGGLEDKFEKFHKLFPDFRNMKETEQNEAKTLMSGAFSPDNGKTIKTSGDIAVSSESLKKLEKTENTTERRITTIDPNKKY